MSQPTFRPTFNVAIPVIAEAAKLRDITLADLLHHPRRNRPIAYTRFGIMWVLRHIYHLGFVRIAKEVGLKDHTSVMHGVKAATKLIANDPAYQKFITDLMVAAALAQLQDAKVAA